ncbi:SpoIIE family protein phosphatase [Nocardioides sp. MAH-18]|uniref:SpoIIE family protein phosphatase n=1 Tax=Nocardioides agri TaxID=2682843 RepID=A0A6L6Y0Z6_9ACTN|nr:MULTISPECIES: PP2C family protein-serine/threonine phosphatase [unclassified Nocardioides]MBA2956392.1 serine/threonine-protein phosphatase [Nocardioides sp. CGMCC 1.13656]MVQ51235.1 SpoIIE family protein phosphatase [Nocardioides sp. MAH-18]
MTARPDPDRTARRPRPRVVRRHRLVRRGSRTLALLVVGTAAVTATILVWPTYAPMTMLMVPLLLGSLLLGPRQLPWFVVFVMVMLMLSITRQDPVTPRIVLAITILYLLCFIVLTTSFRRSRLGVAGVQGESMLVDLRDRILSQGGMPPLPENWLAEGALRSAGGTPFAGDFVVAVRPPGSGRLEVVVVDVSGKGEQAGTRALLLSGAFGGLLGALAPVDFLPAANEYLLRQGWEEGFATAAHLSLDLETGAFEIRTAGHPPAAHLDAGSGRWSVHESEGPVLGLIEDAEFGAVSGEMRRGDALMLYTDGLVETPRRDIGLGIDRMLGQADQLLRGVFVGGADRLVDALGSRNDDRALVLVHRR